MTKPMVAVGALALTEHEKAFGASIGNLRRMQNDYDLALALAHAHAHEREVANASKNAPHNAQPELF